MKNYAKSIIIAQDDSVNQTSAPIDAGQIVSASFHAFFSDSAAGGTLTIQASNDYNPSQYNAQNFQPANWITIPNQSATVTSGAAAILTLAQSCYRWLRIVWTAGGTGTGTITVNANVLSV